MCAIFAFSIVAWSGQNVLLNNYGTLSHSSCFYSKSLSQQQAKGYSSQWCHATLCGLLNHCLKLMGDNPNGAEG